MNLDTVWAVARFCDTQTALRLTSLNKHLLHALSKERARLRFEGARGRIAEHVGELQHRTCTFVDPNITRTDYVIVTRALTVVVHRYIYGNDWSETIATIQGASCSAEFVEALRCTRAFFYTKRDCFNCTSAYITDAMVALGKSELAQMLVEV